MITKDPPEGTKVQEKMHGRNLSMVRYTDTVHYGVILGNSPRKLKKAFYTDLDDIHCELHPTMSSKPLNATMYP